MKRLALFLLLLLGCLPALTLAQRARSASPIPEEQRLDLPDLSVTADTFEQAITRKTPRFKGAFSVGVVFVNFPDCEPIDTEACLMRQSEGAETYFKRYTQETCWPVFSTLGTYDAPQPLGWYIAYDAWFNRIGAKDPKETASRVAELKRKAFAAVQGKADVMVLAYATERLPTLTKSSQTSRALERLSALRKLYPVSLKTQNAAERNAFGWEAEEERDELDFYAPLKVLEWGAPLWPNSTVIVQAEGEAGVMIHELGHVLGAPDTYHVAEKHGGLPGTPVCVPGGPTAPLYARYRYCGLLGPEAYPMVRTSRTLRLAPRWETFDGATPLGIFIPTSHPNYLLHLEYEPFLPAQRGSATRLGATDVFALRSSQFPVAGALPDARSSAPGGIFIHLINVTKQSPYFGTPDLVYTYRRGDPLLRGVPSAGDPLAYGPAIFREGDAFDAESDPANVLPNTLPTGISLTFGPQDAEGAEVTIQVPSTRLQGRALSESLRPVVSLQPLTEALPTSVRASLTMRYRGEPVYTDFGFCYGPKPNPTLRDNVCHLWGFTDWQDSARLQGLTPGATLYVRAYAQNAHGVAYSPECRTVTLPKSADMVPPLLLDTYTVRYLNGFYDGQGFVFNDTGACALLKLMAHFRKPLTSLNQPARTNARSGRRSTARSAAENFSYERLHLDPKVDLAALEHSPRFTESLEDLEKAFAFAKTLAKESGLADPDFTDDFEKRVTAALALPKAAKVPQTLVSRARKAGLSQAEAQALGNPVVPLTENHLRLLTSRIQASLKEATPVLCVRRSLFESSRKYALDSCLIDGWRPTDDGSIEFHLSFTTPLDRHASTQRPSGWYSPSVLFDHTEEGRLIFLQ